jgi:predicted PurR-regulated permease PerM
MRLSFLLLAIILLLYALIMAKEFLYPLTFGILISYLLYPIVNYLEKRGFPRIFSILVPIILSVAIVVIIATAVVKRMNLFIDDLPQFREKTIENLTIIQQYVESNFGVSASGLKNFIVNSIFNLGKQSGKLFSATTGTLFALFMQPVYVFLFLYYRTKFAYFILQLTGREYRLITINILREIATVVTRYMLGVTTVVFILCFFNSLGLLIIGLKYALLIGVIQALFSFIPYFGNVIGGAMTLLFALLTQDSEVIAIRILAFVFIVHFFENNLLSPYIVGNNIRLNPFIIIIGLIAGAMIWGVPGMLVTIPFLAMLKIILKSIPHLEPYAYLLGTRGTKRHALTRQNLLRFLKGFRNKKK